jgi:hypothetical protein
MVIRFRNKAFAMEAVIDIHSALNSTAIAFKKVVGMIGGGKLKVEQ